MTIYIEDLYLQMSRDLLQQIHSKEQMDLKEELKRLLLATGEDAAQLHQEAREVREEEIGNQLFIRASLEFANICSYSCSFCGMAATNPDLDRYQVTVEEMQRTVEHVANLGIGHLHLVAGENRNEKIQDLSKVIRYASDKGLSTTVVIGRRSADEYRRLYEAGASRYILKFETSNPQVYYQLKGQTFLEDRLAHLLALREMGFKIGTGTIVGLPGTGFEDIINDLVLLSLIKPDMASASVFSPNKGSQLREALAGNPQLTLNFMAVMRKILKEPAPIISCSSSLGSDGQFLGLMAGANVISYHSTPKDYIEGFSSYRAEGRIKTNLDHIKKIAKRAKLEIGRYD